jgi:hypothetical protein
MRFIYAVDRLSVPEIARVVEYAERLEEERLAAKLGDTDKDMHNA